MSGIEISIFVLVLVLIYCIHRGVKNKFGTGDKVLQFRLCVIAAITEALLGGLFIFTGFYILAALTFIFSIMDIRGAARLYEEI